MRHPRLQASILLPPRCSAAAKGPSPSPAGGEAAGCGGGRDFLRIVGSSTVYPFATAVAERFARTGASGGNKTGRRSSRAPAPAAASSSSAPAPASTRPTSPTPRAGSRASEVELCRTNGVDAIVEVPIGYDGIVVANAKSAPRFSLTRRQIFLALAKQVPGDDGQLRDNPTRPGARSTPACPTRRSRCSGPPPTSGTRDAFAELVMEEGLLHLPLGQGARGERREALQGDLRRRARGRRLRRRRRERQPDRAEARGQPQRTRHLRLQLPRPEPRPPAGLARRGRRAHLRSDRRATVPGLARALHLRQAGARRRRAGHQGVRRRIRQSRGVRRGRLPRPDRAHPAARARQLAAARQSAASLEANVGVAEAAASAAPAATPAP